MRLPMTEWCGLFLTRAGLLETAAHNRRAHFPCVNVCGIGGDSTPQHKPPSAIFFGGGGRCAITHGTEGIYRSLPSFFWYFLCGIPEFKVSILPGRYLSTTSSAQLAALPRLLNTELNHHPVLSRAQDRMGCSTSSQTSAVDTTRPTAKTEESNGASTTGDGHACVMWENPVNLIRRD